MNKENTKTLCIRCHQNDISPSFCYAKRMRLNIDIYLIISFYRVLYDKTKSTKLFCKHFSQD